MPLFWRLAKKKPCSAVISASQGVKNRDDFNMALVEGCFNFSYSTSYISENDFRVQGVSTVYVWRYCTRAMWTQQWICKKIQNKSKKMILPYRTSTAVLK